ncbi:hypothetical protein ALQ31_00874 [Pseudomonas amygdali pv. morsprunorum]|nr:hypothetical protein ALQ31_00874 [Pseudomonas amygdali pv. morsprunorum]RMU36952.1 hypothetical protein ALP31_200164 [Pseudomonas amygdali pv. morsprunorum]
MLLLLICSLSFVLLFMLRVAESEWMFYYGLLMVIISSVFIILGLIAGVVIWIAEQ